jgi:predicted NBD/HSP70 family sugar kinase
MGLDPSAVFALALQGDPAARIVWNETADLLAIVIGNLSVVLDPQVIVLGGPSAWYWDELVQAIHSRIGSGLLRPVNLCTSALGRDAVILGAAGTALFLPGVLPL